MKIAIVGSNGAVGKELQKLLKGREVICFDSSSPADFAGINVALFCVSSEIASQLIPEARKQKVLCIDSSTAYREDPSVPLVIPEINGDALKHHKGIISSPNCTTTLMLMPLAPLHKRYQIKRIVTATYQAISGAGTKAIDELKNQTKQFLEEKEMSASIFPTPCAFNVFLHESMRDSSGLAVEEKKMHTETQKILGDSSILVTAICVRVPVFRVHSLAVNVEFVQPICLEEITSILENTSGICLKKNPSSLDASEKNEVFCGRIRLDQTQKNTLEMWIVGDQLLKGAALNMKQILEHAQINRS